MGEFAGLLFFQSESDATTPDIIPYANLSPDQWGIRFSEFVKNLRLDLNRPDLSVILAQIGSTNASDNYIHWSTVKEQRQSVQLSYSKMIVTDDLPLKDDVHFTSESYQIIGTRFSHAFFEITKNNSKY